MGGLGLPPLPGMTCGFLTFHPFNSSKISPFYLPCYHNSLGDFRLFIWPLSLLIIPFYLDKLFINGYSTQWNHMKWSVTFVHAFWLAAVHSMKKGVCHCKFPWEFEITGNNACSCGASFRHVKKEMKVWISHLSMVLHHLMLCIWVCVCWLHRLTAPGVRSDQVWSSPIKSDQFQPRRCFFMTLLENMSKRIHSQTNQVPLEAQKGEKKKIEFDSYTLAFLRSSSVRLGHFPMSYITFLT